MSSNSDLVSQLNGYKHILKLSEELLGYAGIPEELKKKYDLVKEKTLEKFKSNPALNDSNIFFLHISLNHKKL